MGLWLREAPRHKVGAGASAIADHGQEDARLLRLIRASFMANQRIYGAPPPFKIFAGRNLQQVRYRAADARESAAGPPRLSDAALVGRHANRSFPHLLQRQFTVTRRKESLAPLARLVEAEIPG